MMNGNIVETPKMQLIHVSSHFLVLIRRWKTAFLSNLYNAGCTLYKYCLKIHDLSPTEVEPLSSEELQ